MAYLAYHGIDPSIPGLSIRDLTERASGALNANIGGLARSYHAWRRNYIMQRDLRRFDAHQLRDIGLDRDAS